MSTGKFIAMYVAASLVVVFGCVLTFYLLPLIVSLVWAAVSVVVLRWLANRYKPDVGPRLAPTPVGAPVTPGPKSAGAIRKRRRRR